MTTVPMPTVIKKRSEMTPMELLETQAILWEADIARILNKSVKTIKRCFANGFLSGKGNYIKGSGYSIETTVYQRAWRDFNASGSGSLTNNNARKYSDVKDRHPSQSNDNINPKIVKVNNGLS